MRITSSRRSAITRLNRWTRCYAQAKAGAARQSEDEEMRALVAAVLADEVACGMVSECVALLSRGENAAAQDLFQALCQHVQMPAESQQ